MKIKNFLESFFGLTLDKRDVFPVEISHLNSAKVKRVMLEKELKSSWSKYLLEIERPSVGRTTINHSCQFCGAPLKIKVYSRSLLKKINMVAGSVIVASILLPFLFFNSEWLMNSYLANSMFVLIMLVLLFLDVISFTVLVAFSFPLEYSKRGISENIGSESAGKHFDYHVINQSPKSDTGKLL